MVYRGTVKNGLIEPEAGTKLPEGAQVRIEVETSDVSPEEVNDLAATLLSLAGKAQHLPADMAANHDHYLYGTPKRCD